MAKSCIRTLVLALVLVAFAAPLASPAFAEKPSTQVRSMLAKEPTNYKQLYKLCASLAKKNQLADARAIAMYLLDAGKKSYKVYNLLGFVFYQQGLYAEAVRALKTSLQLNGEQDFAQQWLVSAQNRLNDSERL